MEHFPFSFQQLLTSFSVILGSSPTAQSFLTLVVGWILCNGRHTLSAVIRAAGPEAIKSHDAYQNFFSQSKWSMDSLWKLLFIYLVKTFHSALEPSPHTSAPVIWIAGDDTLVKHYGRKIWGAGLYRDAVRSSKKHPAYAWGLNWVVLAMIVKVPLIKDRFIAFPILARLNPKNSQSKDSSAPENEKKKSKGKGRTNKVTTVTLMEEMVRTVASWLPEAKFVFCGDGAYACMAGGTPKNVTVVSRIRRDAALYGLPQPKRENTKGRKAKKGKRLLSPQDMASKVGKQWKTYNIDLYGKIVERQLYTYQALWYEVCADELVNIVIVRDPEGKSEDEYFFTTDLNMTPEEIVLCYTGRWAIEVVFRETKQYLGMNQPQARKKEAVLRLTPFCLWLNSMIKLGYILGSRQEQPLHIENDPWYPHKDTISFQDMLTSLRLHFWQNFIFSKSTFQDDSEKIGEFIIKSISRVT